MPNIMILAQAVLQIFCSQGSLWVQCLSLESGIHNLYGKYHDLSSRGSPDFLFTRFFMGEMLKSEKGNNSVKYSQNFMNS